MRRSEACSQVGIVCEGGNVELANEPSDETLGMRRERGSLGGTLSFKACIPVAVSTIGGGAGSECSTADVLLGDCANGSCDGAVSEACKLRVAPSAGGGCGDGSGSVSSLPSPSPSCRLPTRRSGGDIPPRWLPTRGALSYLGLKLPAMPS